MSELSKGWKEYMVAAAIGASPQVEQIKPPEIPVKPQVVERVQEGPLRSKYEGFGTTPEDRFLYNIAQIESSGGTNTDHALITRGMHTGDKAIGTWGLMPKTVSEALVRKKIAGQTLGEKMKPLKDMNPQEMKSYIESNPDVELDLARFLASHVLKRQKGDESRAAYAWFQGHNLFPNQIKDDHKNHYYVDRYQRFNQSNPFLQEVKKSEKKKYASFKERLQEWKKARNIHEIENVEYYPAGFETYEGDTPPPTLDEVKREKGIK